MNTSILKRFGLMSALGLSLCASLELPALGQSPCPLTLVPGTNLSAYLTVYPGASSVTTPIVATFLTYVTNKLGSPATNYTGPIPPGSYPTWCADEQILIYPKQTTVPGTLFSGALYPTCDPNLNSVLTPLGHPNTIVSPAVWNEVNYILNHRGTNFYWDVQAAINVFVGWDTGTDYPEPSGKQADGTVYPVFNPANVQALTNAAIANAASWTPECGNVVGALWITSPTNQIVMLEIPVPCS